LPLAAATNQTGPASASADIDLRNPPATVTLTSATSAVGSGKVVLAWSAASNNNATVTVQKRLRQFRFFSNWTNVTTLAGNTRGYTDAAVTVGRIYQYRVNASNASGSSAWSNTLQVTAQ